MTLSNSKLESTLVSMAGTLIYLREMTGVLAKKPVVPKAVAPNMLATQGALVVLGAQFEATRLAAVSDAQPFLDEWMRRVGIEVGGIFRARTVRAYTHGQPLGVTGGIEKVHLHQFAVSGIRVVDITLVGAKIQVPGVGQVDALEGIPVRDQASFNLTALRDVETLDPATGAKRNVLHVRIPLQEAERSNWARSGDLELL